MPDASALLGTWKIGDLTVRQADAVPPSIDRMDL